MPSSGLGRRCRLADAVVPATSAGREFASAAYVRRRLEAAGYQVTEQRFIFPFFQELAPAELSQVSPTPTDYETGTFDFSGSGEVTGPLVPPTTS